MGEDKCRATKFQSGGPGLLLIRGELPDTLLVIAANDSPKLPLKAAVQWMRC